MHRQTDTVAQTVPELLSVARVLNDLPCDAVGLP